MGGNVRNAYEQGGSGVRNRAPMSNSPFQPTIPVTPPFQGPSGSSYQNPLAGGQSSAFNPSVGSSIYSNPLAQGLLGGDATPPSPNRAWNSINPLASPSQGLFGGDMTPPPSPYNGPAPGQQSLGGPPQDLSNVGINGINPSVPPSNLVMPFPTTPTTVNPEINNIMVNLRQRLMSLFPGTTPNPGITLGNGLLGVRNNPNIPRERLGLKQLYNPLNRSIQSTPGSYRPPRAI